LGKLPYFIKNRRLFLSELVKIALSLGLFSLVGGCGATDSGITSISQTDGSSTGINQPVPPSANPIPIVGVTAMPDEIILSGACPDGATSVVVSSPVNQTVNCQNGQFSLFVNLNALPDGSYKLNLTFNNGKTSQQDLTVDHTSPSLSISNIPNGVTAIITSQNVSAFSIQGTCKSSLGAVTTRIASVVTSVFCTDDTYSANLNLSSLPDGTFTGLVSQVDNSGNKTSKSFEVFKDTSGSSILVNQSNFNNVRQVYLAANTEGQSIKNTVGGGYSISASIGSHLAAVEPRNGSLGYKIEGAVRHQ
jgi:hypothetical protein